MDLGSKYTEIKQFLSLSEETFDLKEIINQNFEKDEDKAEILGRILSFIYNFMMFKQIRPFMSDVYFCIKKTLEIRAESIADYDELFIKNSLMKFIQQYVDYSDIAGKSKEQVLNFLADSLERLGLQPLIINLGLLLKPMYSDQDYITTVERAKEVEVQYEASGEIELLIKKSVDKWLETQDIKLEKQEELKTKLKKELERLASEKKVDLGSKSYKKLLTDVIEMLMMKLTVLSLMESIPEESFEPVPIK